MLLIHCSLIHLSSAVTGFLAGVKGLAAAVMVTVFAFVWSHITRRVIGGATGDTIGANEELSELLTLFLLLF